jgi:hypothetical protein
MALWRDTRHRTEVEADDRYAQARAVKGVTDAASIEKNADKIQAYRVGLVEGRRMSKLAAISERIVEKKAAHDKKADEWAARLDALDQREPGAFAIGDAVIAERDADLKEMEDTMRGLSNLPNVSGT